VSRGFRRFEGIIAHWRGEQTFRMQLFAFLALWLAVHSLEKAYPVRSGGYWTLGQYQRTPSQATIAIGVAARLESRILRYQSKGVGDGAFFLCAGSMSPGFIAISDYRVYRTLVQ
jgi:hypothetical protein